VNSSVTTLPYNSEQQRAALRELLERNGWEERYIVGQLAGLDILSSGLVPGAHGQVYVSELDGRFCGFVSVEFRAWNRLGQLHGLAVEPNLKRRGIASALVRRAEDYVRQQSGRGVYVDTPVTNEAAQSFYLTLGYRHAYTMPEYYDEGLDGVTYLKLFQK
jgi:ribosomal protein S18 acetylase RimI-like enzyme